MGCWEAAEGRLLGGCWGGGCWEAAVSSLGEAPWKLLPSLVVGGVERFWAGRQAQAGSRNTQEYAIINKKKYGI